MKTAKVFQQGNSQAVRLPKEFRVTAEELYIRRSGEHIVLSPKKAVRWVNLRKALGQFRGRIARPRALAFDARRWPE